MQVGNKSVPVNDTEAGRGYRTPTGVPVASF